MLPLKNSFYLFILVSIFLVSCTSKKNEPSSSKPNIIYILADDLGYGELGVYGQQKIKTPNIDALAKSGMIFTQHYSGSPVCAPSRYSLLTGKHTGNAQIRGNDEWTERGAVWNYKKVEENPALEGQRPIAANTETIGKMLQKAGYKTALIGKWGLGAPNTKATPIQQGFDFFYGYNCQRQAHQLYPRHLYKNDKRVLLNNEIVPPHTKLDKNADSLDVKSYAKFQQKDFAPTKMHEEAMQFIEKNKDAPFFMYYASPLPHLPIQVPQKYVEPYRKIFGEEKPYLGNKGYFPNRYPKASYAGMISYLDEQVGEIVAKLKELNLYENTLIIFTSDNGPAFNGGVDAEFFNSAGIFPNNYGRTKGFTYEGGIRVPMIATWKNHIKAGTKTNHISAFWDVLPTFATLTNAEKPKNIDGISFANTLLGKNNQEKHQYLYWEFPSYGGQQAVRLNNWKAVRKNIKKGNLKIELYNLKTDPQEQFNIADKHPEIIKQMEQIMKTEHTVSENPFFKMKALGD